jgi:hypothetical protein
MGGIKTLEEQMNGKNLNFIEKIVLLLITKRNIKKKRNSM